MTYTRNQVLATNSQLFETEIRDIWVAIFSEVAVGRCTLRFRA
jgi:hypothetical protein